MSFNEDQKEKEEKRRERGQTLRLLTWNIPNAVPRCSFVRATVVVTIITLSRPPSFSLLPRSSSRPGRAIPWRPPPSATTGPLYCSFGHEHRVPFARNQRLRRIARHDTDVSRQRSMRGRTSSVYTAHTHIRGCWSPHHESQPASGVQTLRRLHRSRPSSRPPLDPSSSKGNIDRPRNHDQFPPRSTEPSLSDSLLATLPKLSPSASSSFIFLQRVGIS